MKKLFESIIESPLFWQFSFFFNIGLFIGNLISGNYITTCLNIFGTVISADLYFRYKRRKE